MSSSDINEKRELNSIEILSIKRVFLTYLTVIIASSMVVLLFYRIGFSPNPLAAYIACLCGGIMMVSVGFLLEWWIKPEPDNTLKFLMITVAASIGGGLVAGLYITYFILSSFFVIPLWFPDLDYIDNIVFGLMIIIISSFVFYFSVRFKYTKKAIEKERVNRLASDKQALEANLRLLQAQIEPHFLFNTLSNILSLIDTAPAKAKSMLMDFNLYLRTSLATTRPDMTTLDEEVDTIKAYLNIQKIRLGERLNYSIDIPDILLQQPFPPLLLQPLVENAVKHGLEPKVDGGEVKIKADGKNGIMRIIVEDTGQGFSLYNNDGIGIKNIKERIKLIYGEKGHLSLEEKSPNGVEAIIEVPIYDI